MKKTLQKIMQSIGYQITKYPEINLDLKRRMLLLNKFKINKIFDVGANIGQYALDIRKVGFDGEIISIEPLTAAYLELEKVSSQDSKWHLLNIALGNENKETIINIAANSVSSSIREMLPAHKNSAPYSAYISQEKVTIKKLDTIFEDYYKENDIVFLKIDTQGYERNVIDGAENSLIKIKGIQIEMSLIPLYKGEMLFPFWLEYLKVKGFELFSLENGFFDEKSGQLLQVDGLFFKPE
jgi:FkbM family methyltransferase